MIINRIIQKEETMFKIRPAQENINLLRFDGCERINNEEIAIEKYEYNLEQNIQGKPPAFLFLNGGVIILSERYKNSELWWLLNYSFRVYTNKSKCH